MIASLVRFMSASGVWLPAVNPPNFDKVTSAQVTCPERKNLEQEVITLTDAMW